MANDLVTSAGAMELFSSAYLSTDPPWNRMLTDQSSNASALPGLEHDNSDGPFPHYMSLFMTVACTFILVVGLIGNCLVPVVIWNNRDLRNSTNLFLLNLSVADILLLCVSMPTVLVEIHSEPEVWILGEFMCKLVPFVEYTVAHGSVLTILAISFERYYVITRPLRAGYTCTRMRALFIIIAIWVFGSLSSSPMLFIAQFQTANETDIIHGSNEGASASSAVCLTQANTSWQTAYFISAICLFFFVPLVILVVIYSVIARHLVADPCTTSNHRMQVTSANANDNPNLRARRQVVAMLGTVVVFFFICLLPFRIFLLWFILSPEEDMQGLSEETYYNALNFCRVMYYINSAINPILYNAMSSKFRSAFLKALGFNWRRKRLLRHLSRQSTFNTTTTTSAAGTSSSAASHIKCRLGDSHQPVATVTETKSAAELVKSMAAAKEFIFTQHAHANLPARGGSSAAKPLLHLYGRQGSYCNALAPSSSLRLAGQQSNGAGSHPERRPQPQERPDACTRPLLQDPTTNENRQQVQQRDSLV